MATRENQIHLGTFHELKAHAEFLADLDAHETLAMSEADVENEFRSLNPSEIGASRQASPTHAAMPPVEARILGVQALMWRVRALADADAVSLAMMSDEDVGAEFIRLKTKGTVPARISRSPRAIGATSGRAPWFATQGKVPLLTAAVYMIAIGGVAWGAYAAFKGLPKTHQPQGIATQTPAIPSDNGVSLTLKLERYKLSEFIDAPRENVGGPLVEPGVQPTSPSGSMTSRSALASVPAKPGGYPAPKATDDQRSQLASTNLSTGADDLRTGLARLSTGDASSAIEFLTRAMQSKALSPRELAIAYHHRGAAFAREGQSGRGILDFTTALWAQELPRELRTQTLVARGATFETIYDFASAMRDYDLAIRLKPSNAEAYSTRGNLHRRMKQHALALADYDMALRHHHPHPKHVLAWKGMALGALGRPDDAARAYNRGFSIDEVSDVYAGGGERHALAVSTHAPIATDVPPSALDWASENLAAPTSKTSLDESITPALRGSVSIDAADGTSHYVFLGSFKTRALAEKGWQSYVQSAGDLLAGVDHVVKQEVLSEGVSAFRLYGDAPIERDKALHLCRSLRDKAISCIVVRR